MKRTLTAIGICIVLSFAVYGISLYLGLRLTDWGHYNLRPAEGRPDLAAALESKRRLAITFYLIVYPIIACLVGLLAARRAEHHLFVAVVGVLPIFAYVLRGEGIHALPLFSLLVDIVLAALVAGFVGRRLLRSASVVKTGAA